MVNTTVSLNTTSCGEPVSVYHQLITSRDHALPPFTLVVAIITALTITENLALAAALIYQRLTPSGSTSVTSLVVLAMAVSDALMATLVMPLAVLELGFNGRWGLGQGACVMRYALEICWCTLSVYHVATIAVDRYLAVCRPLLYRSLTLKSGFLLLTVCWLLSLFLALLPISAGWFRAKEVTVSSCGQTFLVCVPVIDPTSLFWTFIFSFFTPIVLIFSLYFAIIKQLMKINTINTPTYVSRDSIKVQRSNFSRSTIPEISKSSQISLQNSSESSGVVRGSTVGVSRDSQGGVSRDSQDGVSRDSQGGVSRDSQGGVSRDSQGGVSRDSQGGVSRDSQGGVSRDSQGGVSRDSQGGVSRDSQGGVSRDSQGGVSRDSQGGVSHDSQGGVSRDSQGGVSRDSQGGVSRDSQGGVSRDSQGGVSRDSQGGVSRDSQGGVSRDSQGGVSRDSQGGVSRDSQGGVSRDSQGGVSRDSQGGVSRDMFGCSTSAKTSIPPVSGRQAMSPQHKTRIGTIQDRTMNRTLAQPKSNLQKSKRSPNVENHVKIGKRNMKAIKNIGILLLCFMLCWLPFSVTIPISIYHRRVLPRWSVVLFAWLGYTNSTINPILLCGNKSVRAALWALVARVRCWKTRAV
ncbi:5-hydroxytryptamine receptor 2A-like [Physella acuta]|uniref:5-hydroxytryptamine receptor 2A-like n=1 Tax=Physella acuta TaxID=109671 RepID=UPI0027DD99BA|nr:5-hydroxytryptamine receptor 2A-like [Physella acuta]